MPQTVQLFVTCLVDGFAPEVGEATVELLEARGLVVEFPFDQTCCGQPAFNAGFAAEAAKMARHTIDVLDATDGPIVTPSGSCAEMIVHHYRDVLSDDAEYSERARRVGARVRELTQFLVDDLGITDVGATIAAAGTITYHPSCHGLRGLGLTGQAPALLDAAAGSDRVELPGADECCGFGGLFAVKMPEVSTAMAATKLDNVVSCGAATLVGSDVGCLLHLEGAARRREDDVTIVHIAQLLANGSES